MKNSAREPWLRRFLASGLLLFVLAMPEAKASHFRYGNLSWTPGVVPGEVIFYYSEGWRRSFEGFSTPNLGDPITYSIIDFGDGTEPQNVTVYVTDVHVADDWVVGEAVITHTFSGAGPYHVAISGFARMSTLNNRADLGYNLSTKVHPLTGNSSPYSCMPPIVVVPTNKISNFSIPGNDPDGDSIRWRLATSLEAVGAEWVDFDSSPKNISINSTTGNMTFIPSGSSSKFWTTQVMVEDFSSVGTTKTKNPVDFLIQFKDHSSNFPTATMSPASPIRSPFGVPISFTISGTDADDETLEVRACGIPEGATLTPTLPASIGTEDSVEFNWTPTEDDLGTYAMLFVVADDEGHQSLKTMQLIITDGVEPFVTIVGPEPGRSYTAPASITVEAQATDDSGISKVEFYLNQSIKVGEDSTPDGNGIYGTVIKGVKPGIYSVKARAIDVTGTISAFSEPLTDIYVRVANPPVVTLREPDPFASENGGDKGVIRVYRKGGFAGNLKQPLKVYYTIEGNAENGVDYQTLSGVVTIPAGASSAPIKVFPLAPDDVEGHEIVSITLQDDVNYLVGPRNTAGVIILDGL